MIRSQHIQDTRQLYLNGVSVSFDGFRAINNLCLQLEQGELRAVIGPNGAGKSTMMDIITGKTRPDNGEVIYRDNTDLTRFNEAQIANMGIGRKFQKPSVLECLTLDENLQLACKGQRGVLESLLWKPSVDELARMVEVLELIHLEAERNRLAGDLSHGQKQWLEIGMLLMQDPDLIFLDEPAAGMTDRERRHTVALIKRLSGRHTVLVVEHDMEFIRALDCPVTVLHEGHVLAEGTMDQVQANAQVIEVYLGR
jgi:urea transport system ATP-binding protein